MAAPAVRTAKAEALRPFFIGMDMAIERHAGLLRKAEAKSGQAVCAYEDGTDGKNADSQTEGEGT
ncbi:hypothetical protein MASR2M8_11320 [Opitutaceae bacterium]